MSLSHLKRTAFPTIIMIIMIIISNPVGNFRIWKTLNILPPKNWSDLRNACQIN